MMSVCAAVLFYLAKPSGRYTWAAETLPNGRKALLYAPGFYWEIHFSLSKSRAFSTHPTLLGR
jgi:hypothetical protein